VRTLLAQTAPVGDFEILIVDGMSNDGTRDVLRRLASQNARLRLVDNPLGITPCGMNCGIRTATGHWIAIMGSHHRYAPDYRLGAGRWRQTTNADNVGGAMVCDGESLFQRAIAAAHHSPISVVVQNGNNPDYEGRPTQSWGVYTDAKYSTKLAFSTRAWSETRTTSSTFA